MLEKSYSLLGVLIISALHEVKKNNCDHKKIIMITGGLNKDLTSREKAIQSLESDSSIQQLKVDIWISLHSYRDLKKIHA